MNQQGNWQQDVWGQGASDFPDASGTSRQTSQQTYQIPGQQPQSAYDAAYGTAASSTAASSGAGAYAQPAYASAGATAQPKRGKGWIVGLVAVILLFAFLFFGMASCNAALSNLSFSSIGGSDDVGYVSGRSIGIIEIDGTIQYDGTTASPEGLKAQLDRAQEDPNIEAVVLRVNSGGGTATAGEEMATYVREFSKPVVVSSASMNASAAYEISSQADYIFTAKTTAIGAIGTAIQITDVSELLDKLGIKIENITSAESKDSSYGTRALSDDELAYYQNMVNQINETFIETVAQGRLMDVEEVRALATGLTFTGMDAVENGLADEIGTLEDAVAMAAELAGVSSYETVYLRPSSSDLSDLLSLMSSQSSSSDLHALLKGLENGVGIEG